MRILAGSYILYDETSSGNTTCIVGRVEEVDGDILLLSAYKSSIDNRPIEMFRHDFLLSVNSIASRPNQFFIFKSQELLEDFLLASESEEEVVFEDLSAIPPNRLC